MIAFRDEGDWRVPHPRHGVHYLRVDVTQDDLRPRRFSFVRFVSMCVLGACCAVTGSALFVVVRSMILALVTRLL